MSALKAHMMAIAAAVVSGIDLRAAAFDDIPRRKHAPRNATKDRSKVKAARKQAKTGKKR